jgi:hypothetical protein
MTEKIRRSSTEIGGAKMAENRYEQGYRSKWKKYVLIYLLVGAVLYGLIYLVFFSGAFAGGGGGGIY